MSGKLLLGREPVAQRHAYMQFSHELEREQATVASFKNNTWKQAYDSAWPDEFEDRNYRDAERGNAEMFPIAVLGPAGSGKSYTIQTVMRDAMEHGARVVMACPTRILVATCREKMPDLDVDSIHSTFQIFKPEQQTLDVMTTFDLIVIEEVGPAVDGSL